MAATGAGTRVGVTLKLPQLQNLCKRDPEGYREDYDAQIRRLESELGLLALHPDKPNDDLMELMQFAAAVASSSYKGPESERIARLFINLLIGKPIHDSSDSLATFSTTLPAAALNLHRTVRKTTVSALILMRNKGAIEPLQLMELFFCVLSVIPDKTLREMLYCHLIQDMRNLNKTKKNDKLNKSVQAFLHRIVTSSMQSETANGANDANATDSASDIAAKRATDMVCELYRRRVWTDDKTVAIVASAVLSSNKTVMCRAMRFFLGIEEKMAQDEQAKQETDYETKNRIDYHSHSKKTASRQRHVERQIKNRKKALLKKEKQGDWMDEEQEFDRTVEEAKKLYPAMELLRDPQGLAESVFKRLRVIGSYKFDTRLLMINFVTRLVGNHELLLLPLYSYLTKYIGGHQKDVTAILAYVVQACHSMVPPDEVYGLLKAIAHHFITERCSEEQIAVGINSCRAICSRCPSVMSEEESKESEGATIFDIEAFARDIAGFANHRDRSVSIAAKSWVNFVRSTNPGLLQGKDRGLVGSALHRSGAKPSRYGAQTIASGVEGADLLAEYEAKKALRKNKQQSAGAGEEDQDDDDDDMSGEWEDVSHDGDELVEGEEDEEEEADDVSGEWEDVSHDGDDDSDGEDKEAPELVRFDDSDKNKEAAPEPIDLSKMTQEERDLLKQKVSSGRIFTASDFKKMRKLVEREQRLKSDPREAARRKRAAAKGEEFQLSDDSDDDSDDEEKLRITGAVNPEDIMAEISRRRQNKAERLEKVMAGRSRFETKERPGGSTNVEKKRKKNFLMTKNSRESRSKGMDKKTAVKRPVKQQIGHLAKKRRRKM
jgi:protein SDA1